MKKHALLALTTICILGINQSAIHADPFDPSYLKEQHMKQFNVFGLKNGVPSILISLPIDKKVLINQIVFEKNEVITNDELMPLVDQKLGTKLSPEEILQIQQKIVNLYKDKGYNSAIVNTTGGKEPNLLIFTIYEGPKTNQKPAPVTEEIQKTEDTPFSIINNNLENNSLKKNTEVIIN